MTHYGSLGLAPVSDNVRDIRGTTVRGTDGTRLGNINDLIFDHDTMEIHYLVVDGGDWLAAGTFLLPADRVSVDKKHEDGLATDVTRQQIKDSPQYDRKSLHSQEWKNFEQEFKKYWDEEPVMHMKDTYRIITPPEEPAPAHVDSGSRRGRQSDGREINVADLFPERMTPVFSDTAPSSSKVTLRPKSAARAEEAAAGVTLLKPHWWEAFENYLQINKSDIQARCPECTSTSDNRSKAA